jgi:uncharacterized membrane protein (UPF0127 family)
VVILQLINKTRAAVLAENVELAITWFARLRGLLSKTKLPQRQCLVLHPCNSIHTCFMKFNIDVLFVKESGEIVHQMENVSPYRFSPVIKEARFVIELPAGEIRYTGTKSGDFVNSLAEILQ